MENQGVFMETMESINSSQTVPSQGSTNLPAEHSKKPMYEFFPEINQAVQFHHNPSTHSQPTPKLMTLEDYLKQTQFTLDSDTDTSPLPQMSRYNGGSDRGTRNHRVCADGGPGQGSKANLYRTLFGDSSGAASENRVEASQVVDQIKHLLDDKWESDIGEGEEREARAPIKKRVKRAEKTVEREIERRQRRRIKNRESATRSRMKKQAMMDELEAENKLLQRENATLKQEKQILEGIIKRANIGASITPEKLKRSHSCHL